MHTDVSTANEIPQELKGSTVDGTDTAGQRSSKRNFLAPELLMCPDYSGCKMSQENELLARL